MNNKKCGDSHVSANDLEDYYRLYNVASLLYGARILITGSTLHT